MDRQEIIEAIRDYVNDEKAKYAVLINGEWGCGKTYLYKNYLNNMISSIEVGKNERKANIYISLYGISNIQDLSKELLTNFVLKITLNENKSLGKVYEVSSGMLSVISNSINFYSFNGLSVDFKKTVKEIQKKIRKRNMVICFDDLERCSIPITELLGFINNLVEHCNCKVIILADEKNIGKLYANTNLEWKYSTLLTNRMLIGAQEKTDQNNIITIENLKKLNEEVYSDNYFYKDLKEKVIGLTLEYVPSLNEEIDNIIQQTVNSNLSEKLKEKKDDILKYMEMCNNTNIRIIKNWLVKFEKICNVLEKHYSDFRFSDNIYEKFLIYSIRVACALGKNKLLMKWEENAEYGFVQLDDNFFIHKEGYRFIDELFISNNINEIRVCKAARYINDIFVQEQENKKRYSTGVVLAKLADWYKYEDNEIYLMLDDLKKEIEENKYKLQGYQYIIGRMIELKARDFNSNKIEEILQILKEKAENWEENIEIENFNQDLGDPNLQREFHYYYDPIYKCLIAKNNEKDEKDVNELIGNREIDKFIDYCKSNHTKFIENRTFINNIDLECFIDLVKDCSLENVYKLINTIHGVYNFSNIDDYFANDKENLKKMKLMIEEMNWYGITRNIAKKSFCNTLDIIISTFKNDNKEDFIGSNKENKKTDVNE